MEVEVTITGLADGVFFAWMKRNVVSLDDSDGQIAPMYCRSVVRDEGRREEIHDRTSVDEVNCEREEPLIYSPSVAGPDVGDVETNEREERVGVLEALVMSMKREAPSVAVQSVNVDPVMVSVEVPDVLIYIAPPFDAVHRVNVVESVIERVEDEEIVPDIAAPFPPAYVRSVNAHDAILSDPPELIETAELGIVTAEPGVDDAIEMLSSVTLPPPTFTTSHPAVRMKSIC